MTTQAIEFGPLAALAGEWEGNEGVDVAYSHVEGRILETPYRERMTFKPFGPVENGTQVLYGLDYRTAAWRGDEENPFHTEIGYWLWDAAAGQVMRCFMVPRGSTLIAGGTVAPDAVEFTLRAELGSETYGVLSNLYLANAARTTGYEVTISVQADGSMAYTSTTTIIYSLWPEPQAHTDRNVLRRISA
ncbi:heme-binding beta-barrel domain-containing protein [Frankia sp. Cppng1_Ct_nod]|uniref:heme-binding beta-barrel domain-containing protein n=1 Tax=Frankia sp. Cppng1_Ct_nod TaxID=2897162 RepID=UPI00104162B8|nr:heme-binding beta-barrel domain-containing protein [Frankia sp. Cppng1_Ct_nod]